MTTEACAIAGCDYQGEWLVRSPHSGSESLVYIRCRDELLAVYGWELVK